MSVWHRTWGGMPPFNGHPSLGAPDRWRWHRPRVAVTTGQLPENPSLWNFRAVVPAAVTERIKMPKRGVNWAFLKFIARIKSY
jgi:hypothetical protein